LHISKMSLEMFLDIADIAVRSIYECIPMEIVDGLMRNELRRDNCS
jgi:hypothetical protein